METDRRPSSPKYDPLPRRSEPRPQLAMHLHRRRDNAARHLRQRILLFDMLLLHHDSPMNDCAVSFSVFSFFSVFQWFQWYKQRGRPINGPPREWYRVVLDAEYPPCVPTQSVRTRPFLGPTHALQHLINTRIRSKSFKDHFFQLLELVRIIYLADVLMIQNMPVWRQEYGVASFKI